MIGWYVHHHGAGHATRLAAIAARLRMPVTAFSSLPRPAGLADEVAWVRLPGDADVEPGPGGDPRLANPTAGGLLHWAPIGHAGHRARFAAIAAWIERAEPRAFVVDVSAEVAVFVRLLGVPTITVALPGARTDPAHALAFGLSDRLLAAWAPGANDPDEPSAFDARTIRTGAISRYDGRAGEGERDPSRVLFLGVAVAPLAPAVRALEAAGYVVETAGADASGPRVDDVWPLLGRAGVVVTAAGQNAIADVAAAGARAVVVPQERPFGEQEHTGRSLRRLGLAELVPAGVAPGALVAAVGRAAAGPAPEWAVWGVAGAAERAARAIEEVAA